MSGNAFTLHLGQGWYVDADGRLHSQPVEGAPVYELPGGLPFEANKVKDAFKDLGGVMPDAKDPKSVEKWTKLGVPKQTVEFLSAIGVAAGAIATAFGVIAFVFDVAKLVGLFKDPPDPLMEKLTAVANELRAFSRAEGNEARDKMIADIQSDLTVAVNAVKAFVDELRAYPGVKLDDAKLQSRLQDMRAAEGAAAGAALRATNALDWSRGFDRTEYTGSWFWVSGSLQVHPEGAAPAPFTLWPQGQSRVDHRIMVPVALYAVEAYLTTIKGITPEYRTVGKFRDNLRSLALQVSALAANIRAQGIAKIVYRPEDFLDVPDDFLTDDPGHFTSFTHFTVGAVDLAAYTDIFLRTPPVDSQQWFDAYTGKTTIRRGGMEMFWKPPHPFGGPNRPAPAQADLEANAAAANAIAEERYVELLAASGYLQLAQVAAQLRHLSTEPDASETVAGDVSFSKTVLGFDDVTAHNADIPWSPEIKAKAFRRNQEWGARVRVQTQPRDHDPMIGYRIVLRSMRLPRIRATIMEPDYGWDYRPVYENDPALPGFKALRVDFFADAVLEEFELARGESPRAARTKPPSTVRLHADTFDWYLPFDIPAQTGPGRLAQRLGRQTETPEAGVEGEPGPGPLSLPLLPPPPLAKPVVGAELGPGLEGHVVDEFLWGVPPDANGVRRHLAREEVTIDWSLEWKADRLAVTIRGRPTDRNCALFLVVEETLISTQRLHTAFAVPLNNQVTYVPQSFFDAEEAAWRNAGRIADEMTSKWPKSVMPGPGEPVEGLLQPSDFLTRIGLDRAAEFFEQNAPALLKQAIRDVRREQRAQRQPDA